MKKLIVIFILLIIFSLCGFKQEEKQELRGVFVSYIEEKQYLTSDYEASKDNIRKIVENLKTNNYNLIILQVRSNSDAIYPSDIFPFSNILTGIEGEDYFDVLDYFLQLAHQNDIKVYAWINPYRIRTTESIDTICPKNPAYKYLNTNYIYINDGIYYNPSKQEVEDLIVEGIEEILKKYKVDGIIFDDYFYPADDIDIEEYNTYIKTNDYIELKDYHLMIINKMVKRVHELCSKYNIIFGISPDGNINNNYTYLYADIYKWLDSTEYVDFIMPQIYYGFENENQPFYQTVHEWNKSIKNDNIKLIIALALYKSGNIDIYAKSGSEEWIHNKNIIKKEIIISRNLDHYAGFSLFRYDHLYNENLQNENIKEEIKNLHQMLN